MYVALAGLVVASGFVSAWNIGFAGYSTFYSTAASSMSLSWRAFFFGALDPQAHITLDKLSGFLLPQAISARLFGFHPWSIALPQVIEGMVTVAVTYLIGFRWRGIAAGFFAAVAVATTPLLGSMFGHVMEDGLLTMSLALSFLCLQSALRSGRWLPLLASAFWIAVGFQAKMMQAWIILPAMAIGYLFGAPHGLRSRLGRGSLAGLAAIGLSLVWMTAIQLTPAADRPYIDGSTNNNVYSMVFGYNGFNRLMPGLVPGAIGDHVYRPPIPTSPARHQPPPARTAKPTSPGDRHSKLLLAYYTTQVGWLYPLALAGLLFELWPLLRRRWPLLGSRRAVRDGARRSSSIALGAALAAWLVIAAGLLTVARVPHAAYLAAISVQVALLSAAAIVRAIRLYRLRQPAVRAILPGLIVAETLWTSFVLHRSDLAPAFLIPTVLVLGLGVATWLAVLIVRPTSRPRVVRGLVTAGVLAVLLAPTVWTGYLLDRNQNGTAGEAYAGPHRIVLRARGTGDIVRIRRIPKHYRVIAPFTVPPDPHLEVGQERLLRYLQAHLDGDRLLMATDQWATASPFILYARAEVMTMGGFSGGTPTPTLGQLQTMISRRVLRFVLVSVDRPRGFNNPELKQLLGWVRQDCSVIAERDYGGPSSSLRGQRLYSCNHS